MWRMVFSIGLALPATVLPKILIDMLPDARDGYFAMGGILGACMVPLAALVVLAGKEKRRDAENVPFLKSLASAIKFPPFRQAVYMYVCAMLPLRLLMAAIIYYFTYYLRIEGSFEISMAIMMLTSVAALFMWDWVAHRLDKRKAYMIGITTAAVLTLVLLLPARLLSHFVLPFSFVMGLGVSAMHIMPIAIIPEVTTPGKQKGMPLRRGYGTG